MQNDCSGEHNPGIRRKYEVKRNISSARKIDIIRVERESLRERDDREIKNQ